MVNAIRKPDKIPGRISGNTTLKKGIRMRCAQVEGMLHRCWGSAASYGGITLNITYGILR